jgi:hypothetical protein
VTGISGENLSGVRVSVNGGEPVNATIENGTQFSATVTLEERVNYITAKAIPAEPVRDEQPSTVTEGGGGNDPIERTKILNGTDGGAASLFEVGTDDATVVYYGQSNPVESVTVASVAQPDAVDSTVQVYQRTALPSRYRISEQDTVAVFDIAVRHDSTAASRAGTVTLRTTTDRLGAVATDKLRLLRYNLTTDEWEPLPTRVTTTNSTVEVVATEPRNVTTLVALVESSPEETTTVPSATDSSPTEPTTTSHTVDQSPSPESPTPAAQPDTVVDEVADFVDVLTDWLEDILVTASPLGTATASDDTVLAGRDKSILKAGSATDSATEVLYLDGDGLSDQYERTELNTSPVNPDSDIPSTDPDESGDGIVDGAEDPDNETALTAIEAARGTDPLQNNTDGDALSDATEIRFDRFDPTDPDSNDDGVLDGRGDPDNDGLTTATELDAGTSPTTNDSDMDGLTDSEELQPTGGNLSSDPTIPDTDGDGLTDAEERRLGTDPTAVDTDNDGTRDPNETFETESADPELGTSVDITGAGNLAGELTITNGTTPTLNTTSVTNARASSVVNLETDSSFESAEVTISYDASRVVNETELAVYRLNETTGAFTPLNSTVDRANDTVTATTSHFSRFVVFEIPEWESNYETITPPNVGDDSAIAPVDAAFILDSSGSMSFNDPNGLRKRAAKRFTGALLDIDRAAVIDFDFGARTLQPFTGDFGAVNRSIDRVDSSGGTNIGAGVAQGNREYRRNSNESRAKIAVLLTDGRGSGGLTQAQRAAEQNITIYTIGLSNSANAQKLRRIASETGGNFTRVQKAGNLPEIFARIANETKSGDSDGDGLTDAEEIGGYRIRGGTTPVETVRTDPFDPDTDGDGIPDGVEAGRKTGTSVTVEVATADGSGSVTKTYNRSVYDAVSDPTAVDSDGDGLPDAAERAGYTVEYTDSASDTTELKNTTEVRATATIETDDIEPYLSRRQVSPDPLNADSDGDGLEDGKEIRIGTDPTRSDTDGDHMSDRTELRKAQADPALFDASRPTILVKRITMKTVPDEEGSITDALDTKYIVRIVAKDPAGVDRVTLRRGDDAATRSFSGQVVATTMSVTAESFLAQGSQLALGARVDVAAEDVNDNGQNVFITKAGPHLYKAAVKKIGQVLPDVISDPVFTLSLLNGFILGLAGAIESLVDFLLDLLRNALGDSTKITVIEDLLDLVPVLLDRPAATISAFLGSFRSTQRAENPFERPDDIDNIVDGLIQRSSRFTDGFQLGDLTPGPSDYLVYGTGWYAGFALSFIADTVIGAVLAPFSGGTSLLATAAGIISSIASAAATGTALLAGTAFDLLGTAARVAEQVDRFDPEAIVNGTRQLTRIKKVEVIGALTTDLSLTLDSALSKLAATLGLNSGPERYLGRYLATTGREGVDALEAAHSESADAAAVLMSPTTSPVADRVVARRLAAGDVTAAQVRSALGHVASATGATRDQLARTLEAGGREGITFLSATQGTSRPQDSLSLIVRSRGATTSELRDVVRRAGGRNTSRALAELEPGTTTRLLDMDGAAAPGARANIVEAVAAGQLTDETVDDYLQRVDGKTGDQRLRAINRVAFSRNVSETASKVSGNDGGG